MFLTCSLHVLIESDWNLKFVALDLLEAQQRVLIESDWNLKYNCQYKPYNGNIVLIESDWNLKQRDGTLILIR